MLKTYAFTKLRQWRSKVLTGPGSTARRLLVERSEGPKLEALRTEMD